MKVYQIISKNRFNNAIINIESEHNSLAEAIDELQQIALKNDSNITDLALDEIIETRATATYHHTYYINKTFSDENILATLKRIKNEYPSLFECYNPNDSGEAAELDVPYYHYYSTLGGHFELVGGSTLLDKSNVAVILTELAEQGINASKHKYLCEGESAILNIDDVVELDDEQLQFIEETLSALEQYPALDDAHYINLQREYADEQWYNTPLQDRINAIADANEYSDEVISILAARHDSVPRNVFYNMLDMGELN